LFSSPVLHSHLVLGQF